MPEFSTDLITGLGLLVLVVTLGSPRLFSGLTDSSPEIEPAARRDESAPARAADGDAPH